MGERWTYGAETKRSRRRYEESPRVPFMERTLREMTTQLDRKREVTVRRLDRRAWRDAEKVALRPFAHSSLELPGCIAALRMLDTWGQLTRIRRDSADATAALPIENKIRTAAKGGYSLPSASLDASTIEKFLATQPTWARMLLEVIFVDGWEFLRREVAYVLPDPLREAEIKAWQAVADEHRAESFGEWAYRYVCLVGSLIGTAFITQAMLILWAEEMREREPVVANAYKSIRDLQEAMVIVKLDNEPAPQRFSAARVLTIKRWTFDLKSIAWTPKEMSMKPAERERALQACVVQLVTSIAARLKLGRLVHKAVANRDLGDEQSFPLSDDAPASMIPDARSVVLLKAMGIYGG